MCAPTVTDPVERAMRLRGYSFPARGFLHGRPQCGKGPRYGGISTDVRVMLSGILLKRIIKIHGRSIGIRRTGSRATVLQGWV